MKSLSLYYNVFKRDYFKQTLSPEELQKSITELNNLLFAQTSVKHSFGNVAVYISMLLDNDISLDKIVSDYKITITGTKLYVAATKFMDEAGAPVFVSCNNYAHMDKVLACHNKKTEARYLGLTKGRFVVDR